MENKHELKALHAFEKAQTYVLKKEREAFFLKLLLTAVIIIQAYITQMQAPLFLYLTYQLILASMKQPFLRIGL